MLITDVNTLIGKSLLSQKKKSNGRFVKVFYFDQEGMILPGIGWRMGFLESTCVGVIIDGFDLGRFISNREHSKRMEEEERWSLAALREGRQMILWNLNTAFLEGFLELPYIDLEIARRL